MPFTTELFLCAATEKKTSPTTDEAKSILSEELTLDEGSIEPLVGYLNKGDYDGSLLALQKLKPAFTTNMQNYYQLK
jgi:hypothetical protein